MSVASVWVYVRSDAQLWTVGFFDPNGTWHTDSDHSTRESAAKRAHYLNGVPDWNIEERIDSLEASLKDHIATQFAHEP